MNWFHVTKSMGLIEMFPGVTTFGIVIISSFCVTSFRFQVQSDEDCNDLGGKVHALPNSDTKRCCKEIKCPSDHEPKICNEDDMYSTGCSPCPDGTWNVENLSTHMRECVPNDRFNPRPTQFFKKATVPDLKTTNTEKTSDMTKLDADMTAVYDHKQNSSWTVEKIGIVGVIVATVLGIISLLVLICIKKRQNVNADAVKESRSSLSNSLASSNDYQQTPNGSDSSSQHLLDSKKFADLHQDAPSTADSLSLNLRSNLVSNRDNISSRDDQLNWLVNHPEMEQTDIDSLNLMSLSDPISNYSNSPSVDFVGNKPLKYVNSATRQDIYSHISLVSLHSCEPSNYDLREDDLQSPSAAYTVVEDGDDHNTRSGAAPHGEATSHTTIQFPDSGNNVKIQNVIVIGSVNINMQR